VVPAATEIVAALGAADSLVGVSHECVLGAGAVQTPRVTSSAIGLTEAPGEINAQVTATSRSGTPLFTLHAAEIEALRPDVIITQGLCSVCAVSDVDVRALAARLTPAPRVLSISASTLDGVFDDIATIAAALDRRAEGERLVASLRARMKAVHVVLSTARAPRLRVAVLEWTDPPFAAGHWVPEMVYRAGGADVLAVSGQHSREITWDALAEASPAVVLIAPCGYDIARSVCEGRPLVDRDPWMQRQMVWALDATGLVSQPGPRLVDGIETMAAIFNPGLFSAPPPSHAVPLTPG
jgi:iron complex transport system substrate-binding protein